MQACNNLDAIVLLTNPSSFYTTEEQIHELFAK